MHFQSIRLPMQKGVAMSFGKEDAACGTGGSDAAKGLGRDFWLYQIGQFTSTLGDGCSTVAISWWVLEQTSSPRLMSTIMTVMMSLHLLLHSLLSPLGDRLSRRGLMLSGYGLSAIAVAGFAILSSSKVISVPWVMALSVLVALGEAVFGVGAAAALVKVVPESRYRSAVRIWESLGTIAGIAGGILGGTVISALSCSAALTIDAMSFVIAFAMVFAIKADTRPSGANARALPGLRDFVTTWIPDMREGLSVMCRVHFLLGVLAVLAFVNLSVSPLSIIIPCLIKQVFQLPAWYVGLLYAAKGGGVVFGACSLKVFQSRQKHQDMIGLGGLGLVGGGLALLGLPGPAPPFIGMFIVGLGSALFNIPLTSNLILAIPDRFQTRLSVWIFLACQSASPIGMLLAGVAIERIPLPALCCALGAAILALVPILASVREFCSFVSMDENEVRGYLGRRYGLGAD